jgi:5'-nucleotidase / UDP-sugar diphosphatase
MTTLQQISLLSLVLWNISTFSLPLQILHTNDLHGFFESSVQDTKVGGYAKLKTLMDKNVDEAKDKGIRTLLLDAGDFLEGSLFYMVDNGLATWKIMDLMGFEAVTIGNHDWLMGTKGLNQMLKNHPPKFDYLGANFKVTTPGAYQHIRKHIKEYKVIDYKGMRIGIVGLTTNELFYSWAFKGGKISDPAKVAEKIVKKMRAKENLDFVIALTHVGVSKDREIVQKSRGIDLVIGGHSHTALFEPLYAKDKDGKQVPIVQAGSHGRFLGKLLLDLEKGNPLKVLDYTLVPVVQERLADDPQVMNFVAQARTRLNLEYGFDWLTTVIGTTKIPLIHSSWKMTPWTAIITDALRESVGADVSIHSPNFGGSNLNVGDITREDIFQSHPRVFDLENRMGWHIYTVEATGVLLKSIIRLAVKTQQPLSFGGVSFDLIDDRNNEVVMRSGYWDFSWDSETSPQSTPYAPEDESLVGRYLGIDGKFRVTNIRINGKKIRLFRRYKLAINEGIVVGGLGISGVVKLLLRKISRTDITVWEGIMKKVEKMGTITSEYGMSDWTEVERPNRAPYFKSRTRFFKPGRR